MFEKLKALLAPERKAAAAPLVSFYNASPATWSPRGYGQFARAGYCGNAVAHRCVRMIGEAAASVPVLLYQGGAELQSHPLLSLLARPNPLHGKREFIENVIYYLLVAGNSFIEISSLDGTPRELVPLRPDRMQVMAGPRGWVEGYRYAVNGAAVNYAAADVVHLKLFHPLDDHYGLSPLEAAARSLDTHNAASGWNKAMLDNAARPSGALVFTGGDGQLSNSQFERLKQELEAQFQGGANAGRPMVLEGGLDWKEMGFSPRDMDFINAKNMAAREIALAFGVPPMLLGIPGDNTYANFAEANRVFWRGSVIPILRRVLEALTQGVGEKFEPGLRLEPDLDQVEALSHDRDALWARVNAASFLSEAEKRQAVGYGAG